MPHHEVEHKSRSPVKGSIQMKRAPSTVRRAIPPKPTNATSALHNVRRRSSSTSKTTADDDDWSSHVPRTRNSPSLSCTSVTNENVHADPISVSDSNRVQQVSNDQQNSLTPSNTIATSQRNVSIRRPVTQLIETIPLSIDLFIKPVSSDYICALCNGVAKSPYDLSCGHLFCRTCMLKYVNKGHRTCPNTACKLLLPPIPTKGQVSQWKVNQAIRKIVAKMHVRCRSHADGCTAEYMIGIDEANIVQHEIVCEYTQISCEQCNQYTQRKLMHEHLNKLCNERTERCDKCLDMIKVKDMSQHTDNDLHCRHLIYCPNRCIDTNNNVTIIPQSQLDTHRAVCAQQPTKCSICDITLSLCEMNNHLNNNAIQHVNSLHDKLRLNTGQDRYNQLVDELRALRAENDELRSFVTEHKQTVNKQLRSLREYQSEHGDAQYNELIQQKSLINELQHKQQYVLEHHCTGLSTLQSGKRSTSQEYIYQINDHTYTFTLFIQCDDGIGQQKKYTFCVNVLQGALPLPLSFTLQYKHAVEHKAVHVSGVSNKVLTYTFNKHGSGYGLPVTVEQLIKYGAYDPANDSLIFSAVISASTQIAAWRNNNSKSDKIIAPVTTGITQPPIPQRTM